MLTQVLREEEAERKATAKTGRNLATVTARIVVLGHMIRLREPQKEEKPKLRPKEKPKPKQRRSTKPTMRGEQMEVVNETSRQAHEVDHGNVNPLWVLPKFASST